MAPQEKRPFRVLHLINGLGPGGAERSLAELLPYYEASGIDSFVLCMKWREYGVEQAVRALGCPIGFLAAKSSLGRAREVRRFAQSNSIDLIHTTLFSADLVGRLAAARTGIPVLTSLVNTSYDAVRLRDPHVRRSGLWAARQLDGWTARHLTDHFHAISEAVKHSAVLSLGVDPNRITVVERGRDRARLGRRTGANRSAARSELGIDSTAEVVVNIGRQEFQKGQRYLLDAAALLLPARPRLVVLIAGRDGHSTAELRRQHRELGLGRSVRFLGHQEDVGQLLAAADIFAFPSMYEGLGGSALEAMAVGLPIVASDIPALREIVVDRETGLLVKPGSAQAIAAALDLLLDAPDQADFMGKRGADRFGQRFTIERSAARMIELYWQVVTATRRSAGRHICRPAQSL